MKSPAEQVETAYKFPFALREYQRSTINTTAEMQRCAHLMDIGTGKTTTATALALYKGLQGQVDQIMVIMPPILLRQWTTWLTSLGLSVTVYAGTPAKRQQMDMEADAIVLSYGILKNDFQKLTSLYADTKMMIIVDECAAVRNPGSLTFKAVRDLTALPNKHCCLLSGTVINKPWHGYGVIKIKTPETYRSFRQFLAFHITSVDKYDEPNGYTQFELLTKNLMLNAVRVRAEDHLELPPITYQPVVYDLEPKHLRAYTTLVERKLLELDDGSLIDGTIQQRLYHSLQRVILVPVEYEGARTRPNGFQLIDNTAQELGLFSGEPTKLTIFCNYQETNEAVFEYVKTIKGLNAIQAYGKLGAAKNIKQVDRFLNDPSVNVLIAHAGSIGIGLNLQSVCATALFLELPITSDVFQQALGRFYRQGQTRPCLIKFAIAANTIQVELGKRVVEKEDTLQRILPTKQTLRRALTGR